VEEEAEALGKVDHRAEEDAVDYKFDKFFVNIEKIHSFYVFQLI
jgi:hypothetical protein